MGMIGRVRAGFLTAAMGVAAVLLGAGPAAAGPIATTVRAMCAPWIMGAPANTLSDAATRNGMKPRWVGNTLESITLPEKAMFGASSFVNLHNDRLGCSWDVGYFDPRALTAALADIETITVPAPAGPTRLVKEADVTSAGKRIIRYSSPGVTLVVTDAPDPGMEPYIKGSRNFEVRVRSRLPVVKVSGPPAMAPAAPPPPTHYDERVCAYKPGSGKIEIVTVRQKYTPAGQNDGPRVVLRGATTETAQQAGYTSAEGRAWFKATTLVFKGKAYKKYGLPRVVSDNELTVVGEHDGVVVAQEKRMPGDPPLATSEMVLYVQARTLACEFQPYEPVP